MNKLVIIGNGFDLAHGLKTSYKDFALWYLNKVINGGSQYPIILIDTTFADKNKIPLLKSFADFKVFTGEHGVKVTYYDPFIIQIMEKIDSNWVDIEADYFTTLAYDLSSPLRHLTGKILEKDLQYVRKLNKCFDMIKGEFENYLSQINTSFLFEELPKNIVDIFQCELNDDIYVLNFNYTDTIMNYASFFLIPVENINYIHGKINDVKNPIIFGYGNETDMNCVKIENLNENEFTRHFKSFGYLTTDNYQKLFKYLDRDQFDVYIMGHSCGISDKVLFYNIFQNSNFNKVKLYYYQKGKNEWENDFFEKIQELSRHFDINSKHLMRTRVVPFSESKPLTTYKS